MWFGADRHISSLIILMVVRVYAGLKNRHRLEEALFLAFVANIGARLRVDLNAMYMGFWHFWRFRFIALTGIVITVTGYIHGYLTLQWSPPNTDCCMNRNSPRTGQNPGLSIAIKYSILLILMANHSFFTRT